MTCPNCTCSACAPPDLLGEATSALPGPWTKGESAAHLDAPYPGPALSLASYSHDTRSAHYRASRAPGPGGVGIDTKAATTGEALAEVERIVRAAGLPWAWGVVR